MGKGSHRRPIDVDRDVFENNWDAIFKQSEKIKVTPGTMASICDDLGITADEIKEAEKFLQESREAVFSPEGIGDIEPVPGASESDQEAGEGSREGPTPHVEGS